MAQRSVIKEILYIIPFIVVFGLLALLYQASVISNMLLIALGSINLITMIVITFLRYSSFKSLIVLMVVCIPLFLCEFALIFAELGIIGPDNEPARPLDYLYFSIVTFTTLGYGDFRPTPSARPFAALEALVGYVMLGLFVSVLIMINQQQHEGGGSGGKREAQARRSTPEDLEESLRLRL
jgi:hypothetical protein